VCFAEFLHAGQTDGRLPLILWARPTPAGERVWLWLRPGLAFTDLEGHYDKIAVATWATDVRAVCSTRWAALLRVDITRRNTLTAVVDSPLTDLVPAIERHRPRAATLPPLPVPTGLDLPEIPEHPRRTTASPLPTRPATRAANRSTPAAPLPPAVGSDDHTDWI
jgi:hypothetical protein